MIGMQLPTVTHEQVNGVYFLCCIRWMEWEEENCIASHNKSNNMVWHLCQEPLLLLTWKFPVCCICSSFFPIWESAQLKESTTYAAHIWGHFEDVNVNSSQYQARTVSQGSSHVDSVCLCFHIIGATSIHTVKKIKKLPLVLCPCSKNYTKSICITSIYLSQFKIFHFSLCLRKKNT